jgi:hypothetical protein
LVRPVIVAVRLVDVPSAKVVHDPLAGLYSMI